MIDLIQVTCFVGFWGLIYSINWIDKLCLNLFCAIINMHDRVIDICRGVNNG